MFGKLRGGGKPKNGHSDSLPGESLLSHDRTDSAAPEQPQTQLEQSGSKSLTLAEITNCSRVLNELALLSSWQWMAYQPTFPLLITQLLQLQVSYVSQAYALFIGAGMIAMLLMNRMTMRYSIRHIMLGMLWMRAL